MQMRAVMFLSSLCEIPEWSLVKAAWFVHHTLIKIFLQPIWDSAGRVDAAGSLLCSILVCLLCALACVCLHKCGCEREREMLLEKYD